MIGRRHGVDEVLEIEETVIYRGEERVYASVMAPLFVERYIDDIGPGNAWNDVLYHAVERLTALNPELAYLRPGLDAKQPFVARPNAPFRELVTIEQHDDGMQIQPRR